jgi:hypothetical protein
MHSFDLACVARTRDGRLFSTRDPSGAEAAWWLQACDVGAVLAKAKANSGDVPKVAAKLGVRLMEHSAALQRTEELSKRLDTRMHAAQETGDLTVFNREYRRRRLQAQAAGEPFLPYRVAVRRLRKALTEVAAGRTPAGVIARVFDDRRPDPRNTGLCGPSGAANWRGLPNVCLPIPIAAVRAQGRLGQLSAMSRHYRSAAIASSAWPISVPGTPIPLLGRSVRWSCHRAALCRSRWARAGH